MGQRRVCEEKTARLLEVGLRFLLRQSLATLPSGLSLERRMQIVGSVLWADLSWAASVLRLSIDVSLRASRIGMPAFELRICRDVR